MGVVLTSPRPAHGSLNWDTNLETDLANLAASVHRFAGTASARAAYATANLVDGDEWWETDTHYLWQYIAGIGWGRLPGAMIPTSYTSGATIGADGTVSVTNGSEVALDGVLDTANFSFWRIRFSANNWSAAAYQAFQLRTAAGVNIVDASYQYARNQAAMISGAAATNSPQNVTGATALALTNVGIVGDTKAGEITIERHDNGARFRIGFRVGIMSGTSIYDFTGTADYAGTTPTGVLGFRLYPSSGTASIRAKVLAE